MDTHKWKIGLHTGEMLVVTSHLRERSFLRRVKDIDFSSSKKLKENLDQKISSLEDRAAKPAGNSRIQSSYKVKNPLTLENGDFEKYATHKHLSREER